jgi:LemA protein
MNGLYVGLGAAVLVAAWLLTAYGNLAAARGVVDEAWAALEVQLGRRHDLVPPLVAAVREHAPGESTAIDRLVAACAAAGAATSPSERTDAEHHLDVALVMAAALTERHPALGGTGPFVTVQAQLAYIADDIHAARALYNARVGQYLPRRSALVGRLLCGVGDFPERPYFELGGTRDRPGLRLTPAQA